MTEKDKKDLGGEEYKEKSRQTEMMPGNVLGRTLESRQEN
jgi:hypothetical protein